VVCKRFLFSPKRPDRLWGPPGLLFSGYRGSFPRVKRSEREVNNHSPASSAEVMNERSYASAPSICLHGHGRGQMSFSNVTCSV
jgi:hypothetical protein